MRSNEMINKNYLEVLAEHEVVNLCQFNNFENHDATHGWTQGREGGDNYLSMKKNSDNRPFKKTNVKTFFYRNIFFEDF